MRLIDADALPKYNGTALNAVDVARAVETAPTIDPVKHGKWVDHVRDYWCSECGGRIQKEQAKMFLTCPYCGARMDGEG